LVRKIQKNSPAEIFRRSFKLPKGVKTDEVSLLFKSQKAILTFIRKDYPFWSTVEFKKKLLMNYLRSCILYGKVYPVIDWISGIHGIIYSSISLLPAWIAQVPADIDDPERTHVDRMADQLTSKVDVILTSFIKRRAISEGRLPVVHPREIPEVNKKPRMSKKKTKKVFFADLVGPVGPPLDISWFHRGGTMNFLLVWQDRTPLSVVLRGCEQFDFVKLRIRDTLQQLKIVSSSPYFMRAPRNDSGWWSPAFPSGTMDEYIQCTPTINLSQHGLVDASYQGYVSPP
jgi:hypothetical protein